MKIFDCFMYFNEELMLEVRLNELNQYVDKFIIVESSYTHSGENKGYNFNKEKFKKFADKIEYIQVNEKPRNLIEISNNDNLSDINSKKIQNALILENYQRNSIMKGLEVASEMDFIIVSDIDEIPNFKKVDIRKNRNRIILFKQYFFHYKFNLYLKDFYFFGSKGCMKKNLISPQWLRNVKNKKYNFLRLDLLFSNKKYSNILIVEKGGWHFSNVMDEEKIIYKLKSYLHHADFPEELLDKNLFKKLIQEKKIMYDHSADKKADRFSSKKPLSEFEFNLLPIYIQSNKEKFNKWLI